VSPAGTARRLRLRAEEDADKKKIVLGFKDAEKREGEHVGLVVVGKVETKTREENN
jgi:hypothetical protein